MGKNAADYKMARITGISATERHLTANRRPGEVRGMDRSGSPDDTDVAAFLAFFGITSRLKDTLRSGNTGAGRPESVADHSWRAALMALTLEDRLGDVDCDRLIRLLLVHDLAEALTGDTPAPDQTGDRRAAECSAMAELLPVLPPQPARRLSDL